MRTLVRLSIALCCLLFFQRVCSAEITPLRERLLVFSAETAAPARAALDKYLKKKNDPRTPLEVAFIEVFKQTEPKASAGQQKRVLWEFEMEAVIKLLEKKQRILCMGKADPGCDEPQTIAVAQKLIGVHAKHLWLNGQGAQVQSIARGSIVAAYGALDAWVRFSSKDPPKDLLETVISVFWRNKEKKNCFAEAVDLLWEVNPPGGNKCAIEVSGSIVEQTASFVWSRL